MSHGWRQAIDELVDRALEKHDGNLRAARHMVERELYADTQLMQVLIGEIVKAAVENRVGLSHRSENQRILDAHRTGVVVDRGRRQLAVALLLDLVLGNGKRLSQSTRVELRVEAAFYDKQARTMSVKAAFFLLVAACLPDDKVHVEQTLGEEQLHELFVRARSAAGQDIRSADPRADDGTGDRADRRATPSAPA